MLGVMLPLSFLSVCFFCTTSCQSTSSDSTSDEGDMQQQTEDESTSEDVGAEAVRHRLEEQGTVASSSSVIGMVRSAVQAFVSMIDPPPHSVRYWS